MEEAHLNCDFKKEKKLNKWCRGRMGNKKNPICMKAQNYPEGVSCLVVRHDRESG